MDQSTGPHLHDKNRTAIEPDAVALSEQSLRKIRHDSSIGDINLWNERGHERHVTLGSIWSLNHNPILCCAGNNAIDDTDRFSIGGNNRASDEIFWPPLPRLQRPAVCLINRELNTLQSLSTASIPDSRKSDDVVTLMRANTLDLHVPGLGFVRDEHRALNEPLLRIDKHSPNDNIPTDPVRSAHVSGGDAVLT